ncbi:MAG: polyhydroxyalkanoic acid system family protein [Pirellulales bacterium]|nr:polyhydroxyalkanoic acid system family protein [Pirellulales bacterium]
MPKLNLSIPHQLGIQQATERLSHFIDQLRQDYGNQVSNLSQSWNGNALNFAFQAYGMAVEGKMTVNDKHLELHGNLPMAAMLFKGKIESAIRQELTKLLG